MQTFTTTSFRYNQMVCLHTCWQFQLAKCRDEAHLSLCERKTLAPHLDSRQNDFQPEQNVPKPTGPWQTFKYVTNRFSVASAQTESLRCFQYSWSSWEGKVRVSFCHHSFADHSTPEVVAEPQIFRLQRGHFGVRRWFSTAFPMLSTLQDLSFKAKMWKEKMEAP